MGKIKHLMYVPWTGLGLYNGFRGNRWLKNRIKVFKQFVIPSLQAQTSKNFTLWCSWRREEKNNPYVRELVSYLEGIKEFKTIHSYNGVMFWDDKYPDEEAHVRLIDSIHQTMHEIIDEIGDAKDVYMTLQPSDDCYNFCAVEVIQEAFAHRDLKDMQALGFAKGYMMNYLTGELAEYNPATNPPFFTIKFTREQFIDPLKHYKHTGPYKSHEYIGNHLKYRAIQERGFLVGTHSENISTIFNHPYRGEMIEGATKELILKNFGINNAGVLKIKISLRRKFLSAMPYKVQRKLRFLAGEKKWLLRPVFSLLYNFLRS